MNRLFLSWGIMSTGFWYGKFARWRRLDCRRPLLSTGERRPGTTSEDLGYATSSAGVIYNICPCKMDPGYIFCTLFGPGRTIFRYRIVTPSVECGPALSLHNVVLFDL